MAVIGAGTLGERIALMFAAGGSDVSIYNRTPERAVRAAASCADQLGPVCQQLGLDRGTAGRVVAEADLHAAADAWLVVETVAEDRLLKTRLLSELDALMADDAVLATNSSSYPSSELIGAVAHPQRVLNMHFLMPPQANAVELMSCGQTDPSIVAALTERLPRYGLLPFVVRAESVGFIFNRIWAAIKRETLMILEEGVATAGDIDAIWSATFGTPTTPCRLMDRVGLDVVLDIEEHYADLREGLPDGPRRLLRELVAADALGVKTGRGLYADYAAIG